MMENGMKKNIAQGQQWSRRRMAAVAMAGAAAVFLSGCIGGGGGGSSDDDIDLAAAYERIVDCMTYDDVVKTVGAKPNVHDAVNTLEWSYGGMSLRVQTQDVADPGQHHWIVTDKELLRGIQRVKRHGFAMNCS